MAVISGSLQYLLHHTGDVKVWRYLVFQVEELLFQFLVLYFELVSAPHLFTTVMCNIAAFLRRECGLVVFDDIRRLP